MIASKKIAAWMSRQWKVELHLYEIVKHTQVMGGNEGIT